MNSRIDAYLLLEHKGTRNTHSRHKPSSFQLSCRYRLQLKLVHPHPLLRPWDLGSQDLGPLWHRLLGYPEAVKVHKGST